MIIRKRENRKPRTEMGRLCTDLDGRGLENQSERLRGGRGGVKEGDSAAAAGREKKTEVNNLYQCHSHLTDRVTREQRIHKLSQWL